LNIREIYLSRNIRNSSRYRRFGPISDVLLYKDMSQSLRFSGGGGTKVLVTMFVLLPSAIFYISLTILLRSVLILLLPPPSFSFLNPNFPQSTLLFPSFVSAISSIRTSRLWTLIYTYKMAEETDRAGWHSGNALDSRSSGARFEPPSQH
jgi:hypothetical protein